MVMASSTHLPPALFHQEQGRPSSKDLRTVIPSLGGKEEIRSRLFHLRSTLAGDPWKPMDLSKETNQFNKVDTTLMKPVLINIQDMRSESTLFSFGIAENCTRHQKILHYLMSGSSETEKDGLDFSFLSSLMGVQKPAIDMRLQSVVTRDDGLCLYDVGNREPQPSLIYPTNFYSKNHLLDPVGDLANSSRVVLDPDGKVLFTDPGLDMKNVLSVLAEFYMSRKSEKWRRQSTLIPYFTRFDMSESQVNTHRSSLIVEAVNLAPLKSPEKIKTKPLKKRGSRKTEREGGLLYRRNGLHACEILLSLILEKKRGKTTISSVRKSGPELPQLLTQFSAGIAGTGLAVLFSVLCKVASGRVPFCASKLFSTGFGVGLVWLSWAFNRLREAIVYINKSSTKSGMNEKEMMRRVDKSVNEIFFRAATVMAVAVLRLA